MARAATAPELAKFRGTEQWSELNLAIQPATSVYTARINQTFSTLDRVAQLTYDGGSGTLAEVLPGMTAWIGSSAGAYDKGICRIRKDPTASIFYINETSEIQFADDDYLTVINQFLPWQRHLTTSGMVVKMDYDLSFPTGTGDYAPPIIRMGPTAAVLRLTGATVSIEPTVAGYSPITTISSYSTAAPGASATADLTTTTPLLTYNAAGCYRWATTVTDANANTGVGYRWIFVNPTSPTFQLTSCSGDFESGGWSFEVECQAGVGILTVYDGAMVCLWARDWYGGVEGSIGPVASYENVVCVGWVAGETINWNPDQSSVSFTVKSLDWWLDRENAYTTGLFENAAPDVWTEFPTLTCDDIMYHFCVWRSTLSMIADCYFPGDSRRMRYINMPTGSMWSQLKAMADDTIFAKPLVNWLGQLYIQIDLNLLATAARSSIPTVQLIGSTDWIDQIDLERITVPELGFVELSGVKSYDGTSAAPLFSRAPGTVPKHYGYLESPSNHLFTDQAECNQIAGSILAAENTPYKVTIPLSNQGLIDICPHQYITLTIVAGDTPLGITMTAQTFVPRRVEREHDPDTGLLHTTITCVQETVGVAGIAYHPPSGTTVTFPPTPPVITIPPIIPGPGTDFPPVVSPPPGETDDCTDPASPVNGAWPLVWDTSHLNVATGETIANASFSATMRATGATYHSYVSINLTGIGLWYNHLHLYIMDGLTRLGEATWYGTVGETITWDISDILAVPTDITGFQLELDGNSDTDFEWTIGSLVGGGDYSLLSLGGGSVPAEVLVPNGGPVLVAGNYYRLTILAGDLYGYYERSTNVDVFPVEVYDCKSGIWTLNIRRTNCQFALTGLLDAGGGRFYTGNMGSRSAVWNGTNECDELDIYQNRPIGALWAFLWNEYIGIHTPLTLAQMEAIPVGDPNRSEQMLGTDIFFQAVGTQVGVKISNVPYIPFIDQLASWACRIYNVTLTGDRQAFIGNSFVENICESV
jgi:hypothetical protein